MTDGDRRVVMISGANRGIGRAVAGRLAAAGYHLSLGVRQDSERERLSRELGERRTFSFPFEASDRESPAAWVAATVERFGRLDAIVNAAGILHDFSFLDEDEAEFDELVEVNVKGPMRLMRAAYPHLRESGAGRIVNIASLSGLRVPNGDAGYPMSKFAVVALTHAARHVGWHDGVRATAVCPGFVNTDMVAHIDHIPKDKMIQPDDVAVVVQTVIELPNTASVAFVPINGRFEPVH